MTIKGLDERTSQDYRGFHEGVADSFSILSLDTACSGLDFSGDGTGCFRDFENNHYRYPVDNEDPHIRGMPLAAAFWKLQVALKKRYGVEEGLSRSQNLFLRTMLINDSGYDLSIAQDLLFIDAELYRGENSYMIVTIFKELGLI